MRIKTLDKKTLRIDRRPELHSLCLVITVAVSLKISLETQQLNLHARYLHENSWGHFCSTSLGQSSLIRTVSYDTI